MSVFQEEMVDAFKVMARFSKVVVWAFTAQLLFDIAVVIFMVVVATRL